MIRKLFDAIGSRRCSPDTEVKMAKKLRAALIFDQRIVEEKYFSEPNVSLGPTGDFRVSTFDANYPVISGGSVSLKRGMVASLSRGGKVEIAKAFSADEVFSFSEDDWLILNLGRKLDFVLCFDEPVKGGLVSPASELAERLATPLSAALIVSFALHSFFIFAAFWFSRPEDDATSVVYLEPRWIEMLSEISEHQEKEEKDELLPIAEDVDDVIVGVEQNDQLRPKIDDSPTIANLDKVDRPVGLQAALGGSKINNMEGLFGSTASLGDEWGDMPESADGTAFGVGAGFGTGLSGVGFGGGGGGGGGYGGGIGGLGGGGGKGGKVGGPKKSSVKPKPKLEMEQAKEGQFCKESNIREVVQKRAAALRTCYEQQLLADPALSGKIIVFWKIGLDGNVTEASIKSSTMKNDRVESCLTKTVRRLRFDKPDGGICVVEFPFIFTSN